MKKAAAQSRRTTRRSQLKPAAPQSKEPVRIQPEYFEDGRYNSTVARMMANPGVTNALVLE